MDMGFSRERCVEALNFTSTVEAATEYLLTHMSSTPAAATSQGQGGGGGSMELSEDEQIRAAIELSLTAASAPSEAAGASGTAAGTFEVSYGCQAIIQQTDTTLYDLHHDLFVIFKQNKTHVTCNIFHC